jgi:hypothetical protein
MTQYRRMDRLSAAVLSPSDLPASENLINSID